MQSRLNPGMAREQWDTLAKRVKGRRLLLKMNQEQLAAAAGMGQGDISKIERGQIQQTTRIAQLARALECDAHWLATGEGEATGHHPTNAPAAIGPIAQISEAERRLLDDFHAILDEQVKEAIARDVAEKAEKDRAIRARIEADVKARYAPSPAEQAAHNKLESDMAAKSRPARSTSKRA